ncbi:solute carrier family 22 member 9-like [Equus quagga]|uniref:solute carrier family 22 member 9-like n=1 Tax=Equus quagga TaxID=89248 RepID=UPI001EE345DA|nr:solute carrier family 22 member 9-like [Equus quagga]
MVNSAMLIVERTTLRFQAMGMTLTDCVNSIGQIILGRLHFAIRYCEPSRWWFLYLPSFCLQAISYISVFEDPDMKDARNEDT